MGKYQFFSALKSWRNNEISLNAENISNIDKGYEALLQALHNDETQLNLSNLGLQSLPDIFGDLKYFTLLFYTILCQWK